MDVLGDRVLELGPKVDETGPYRNFKLTHDSTNFAARAIPGPSKPESAAPMP